MKRIAFLIASVFSFFVAQSAHAAVEIYKQDFDAFSTCSLSCSAACTLSENWTNEYANGESTPSFSTYWRPDKAGTGSFNTGPSAGHTTGTSTDAYLYMEASFPCSSNAYEASAITPPIDLTGKSSPGLSFWYHMFGTSMGTLKVDVLDASKKVILNDVVPAQTGNKGDVWIEATGDLSAFIGQTIHLRFKAELTGSGYYGDMAIDDVVVFDLLPDVGVGAITGPTPYACGDQQDYVEVEVVNYGANTSDIPVEVTVSGAVNTVLTGTLMGALAFGESKTLTLGPIDTFGGGVLDITAKTTVVNDEDTTNDETKTSVTVKKQLIPVTPTEQKACPGEEAVFSATMESDAKAGWYDAPTGGKLIGTGSIFSTPGNLSTTDYYVGRLPGLTAKAGLKDASATAFEYYSDYPNTQTKFTAKAPIRLAGVHVYPETAGDVTITLRDKNGKELATKTVAMADTDAKKKTFVELGFEMGAGDYSLDATGTVPSLLYNYGFSSYPMEYPLLNITGNNNSNFNAPTWYFWFYDWQVENQVCLGRTKVTVTADPTSCNADLSTTITGPKKAAAGSEVEYEIVVRNHGPTASYGVSLADMSGQGLTHLENSGDCLTAFPCDLDVVKNGATKTIKARFRVSSSASGTVKMTSAVSGTSTDGQSMNNTASVETLVDAKANLALSLTANSNVIGTGTDLVVRMQIANHGPSDVTAANLNAALPGGLELVATSGCDNDPQALPDCALGAMTVGSEKVVTVTAKALDDAPPAVKFVATVSSEVPEGALGDESATLNVIITGKNIEVPVQPLPKTESGCSIATPGQSQGNRTGWLLFGLALAGLLIRSRRARSVAVAAATLLFVSGLAAKAEAVQVGYEENFDSFTSVSNFPSCSSTVSTLSAGWVNLQSDDMDWHPKSGATGSSGTGPSAGHTNGSSTDKYLYTETSGCYDKEAIMHSPPLELQGTTSPAASFWYHAYGSAMGDLEIDILDDQKKVIKANASGTITGNENSWKKFTVDLSPYVGQTVHMAFRYVSGTSYTGDMAIDDFKLVDLIPNVGPTDIVGPINGACGDSQQMIEVQVTNFGAVVKDVPVEVTLSGAVNQVLTGTLTGDLGLDEKKTIMVGPVDIFAGGDITILAKTLLSTDTDNTNDEFSDQRTLKGSAIEVTPASAKVCPGSSAVFQAKLESATNFVWYDSVDGDNVLSTGPIFNAPGNTMTTSYYVGREGTAKESVGPADVFVGQTDFLIHGGQVIFQTLADMQLEGVHIYAQEAGKVVINLRDEFGTKLIASKTYDVKESEKLKKLFVPLDFFVPAGKFRMDDSGSEVFLRGNLTGITYPYTSTFVEVTGLKIGTSTYPNPPANDLWAYFYDWKVANFVCKPRTKVELVADPSLCDADLVVQASGPATANAGGTIEYTVLVRNNGPTAAYGVSLADTLPEGFTHVKTTGDCDTALPCDFGAIDPGSSKSAKVTYAIAPNVKGKVEFKATATSTSNDPDPSNNEATAETTIEANSDGYLQLTANAETIGIGAEVTFRMQVANQGPASLGDATISAALPAGLTLVATSGCENDPSAVPDCQLGTIDPGQEKVVTVTAKADNDAPRVVVYNASLKTSSTDTGPGNETASLTIVINPGDPGQPNVVAGQSSCGVHATGAQNEGSMPWALIALGLAAATMTRRRRN